MLKNPRSLFRIITALFVVALLGGICIPIFRPPCLPNYVRLIDYEPFIFIFFPSLFLAISFLCSRYLPLKLTSKKSKILVTTLGYFFMLLAIVFLVLIANDMSGWLNGYDTSCYTF